MNIVSMDDHKIPGEIAITLKHLKDNLPEFIEMQAVLAKLQRRRFLYLRKEGFSEDQALKLSEKIL